MICFINLRESFFLRATSNTGVEWLLYKLIRLRNFSNGEIYKREVSHNVMLSHPGFSIISNHSKYLSTPPLFSHEGPRFFFYVPASLLTPLVLHRTDTWSMVSYTILSKDIETQVKCIIFLLRLKHFFTRLRTGELIESMNDFWVKGHLVCSKVLKGQQCPWMLNDDLESNAFLKI